MYKVLEILGLLLAGGLATSSAEYKLQYNLVDYIVKGIKKVLGFTAKIEAETKDIASRL